MEIPRSGSTLTALIGKLVITLSGKIEICLVGVTLLDVYHR